MGAIGTIFTKQQSIIRRIADNAVRRVHFSYCMLLILPKRIAKQRSRRVLANLEDHELRDIGITREQANEEAAKPFWD